MQQATCVDCDTTITRKPSARGPLPKRCPSCKAQASKAPKAPARHCEACAAPLALAEVTRKRFTGGEYCFACVPRTPRRAVRADDGTTTSRLTCRRCGTPLVDKQKQFCSLACDEIANGRRLAEPIPDRTCVVCGATFTPTVSTQRCCPPTDEDRERLKGNAVSRCAKRAVNHSRRTRLGKTTKPLTSPLASPFDCEQCRTPCVPGQDGVAAHATRFCGYDCKMQWHSTHEDGAMTRWAREQGPAYAQAKAYATAVERLLTCPPRVTASDVVAYRRALRADPCAYCGAPSQASDHIVPKADGGSHDWDNRTGACHRCNNLKQSTPLLVFLAYKQTREAFEPWRAIVAAIHTRRKQ